MSIKTFRDLKIWAKGMEIVKLTYKMIKKFPKNEEYALSAQLRRAAISIPSNIAEGFGRKSKKEFHRFLHISLGSLFELQTQFEIASDQKYITKNEFAKSYDLLREFERMICSFITSNQALIENSLRLWLLNKLGEKYEHKRKNIRKHCQTMPGKTHHHSHL